MIGFLVLGVLSGLAQWGGRSPHPAVVNPVCGQDAQAVVSLDGEWDFTTCEREGGSEQYHRNGNCSRFYEIAWKNAVKVRVPSCWEAQGVGEPGESECWAIGWDASVKPLRHKFMGSGWYRRSVRIPSAWQGRRVWIKLGGVKSAGYVWVNGRQVALTQNYCATEKYEITDLVTPGQTARVAIQADNRMPSRKGLMSHTHCFGGVYRSVELEATPTDCFIDDAWVRGDFDRRQAEVHVDLAFAPPRGAATETRLRVTVGDAVAEQAAGASNLTVRLPLGDFRPWSPEHPNLYTATVELVANDRVVQTRRERFGVRKLEVVGKEFRLNGRPFYFRSFGDDCVYPLTGLSPADRGFHRANLRKARAAGFNAVRLHTHCELPEYFDAADELGILVQPELPYYSDEPCERFPFDPKRDVTELWRHYRRHPSFAVYSMGNEGSFGPDLDRALHRYVKALDPDRLKINQDNHRQADNTPETADFLGGPKTFWPRGSVDPDRPFVTHEYLNLCVKFDVRSEDLYTGAWRAPATRADRAAWLAKFGLDEAWGDRLQDAQHALQAVWQKHGVEWARADPCCDGYNFWTIADVVVWNARAEAYSAQGLFDPFWRTKRGGLSPEDFAAFNSESCVILDSPITNRVLTSGGVFAADVLLAHYGERDLAAAELDWRFAVGDQVLAFGRCDLGAQPAGPVRAVTSVRCQMPDVDRACKAVLEIVVRDGGAVVTRNGWDHWLFPRRTLADVLAFARAKGVTVAPAGSAAAQAAVREGRALVALGTVGGEPNVRLGWWWMGRQMGMALAEHPVLRHLPHEGVLSPLLFRIVREGRPLPVDGLTASDLIVVGEGGEACYTYLAERRHPNGARELLVNGLDLLADTPEGNALLLGAVEELAAQTVR